MESTFLNDTQSLQQFMYDITIMYGIDIARVILKKGIFSHKQLTQYDVIATHSLVLNGLDLASNKHGIHFDVKKKYKTKSCLTIKKRRNSK